MKNILYPTILSKDEKSIKVIVDISDDDAHLVLSNELYLNRFEISTFTIMPKEASKSNNAKLFLELKQINK